MSDGGNLPRSSTSWEYGNDYIDAAQSSISGGVAADYDRASVDLLYLQPVHCCWGGCRGLRSIFVPDCFGCQCTVMGCVILLSAGEGKGCGVLGHRFGPDAYNIGSASMVVCADDWELEGRSAGQLH